MPDRFNWTPTLVILLLIITFSAGVWVADTFPGAMING